ncbi:hypothetical protein BCR44DRAFT_1432783 [Catenaria anguillulae PL171]|uniref:Uncharacterized protein n=1 Tax=Catenaria anguillulae PL171 TaxID=765915 RepID=A0A1Y2HND8_9FUNG|nr:hypothetical protein BCR44DRAFT_1432783 [Catenaria anguillulae PL171]
MDEAPECEGRRPPDEYESEGAGGSGGGPRDGSRAGRRGRSARSMAMGGAFEYMVLDCIASCELDEVEREEMS